MKTLRLSTSEEDIRRAGEIIKSGGLVAFPTETVYGLGADALSAEAVRSVYEAKGRPSDNPMIVHIADMKEMDEIVSGGLINMSANAKALASRFFPGPLTMVLPKKAEVPDVTTGGLDTVAVRMPESPVAQALIRAAGVPVAAPSANTSGRPSPTVAEDVLEDMDGRIDAVIMGGQSDVGIESTVIDMTEEIPVILRPGIITKEQIESVLGCEVLYDKALLKGQIAVGETEDKPKSLDDTESETKKNGAGEIEAPIDCAEGLDSFDDRTNSNFAPRSPGMKYKHYSPKAKVRLIAGDDEAFAVKVQELEAEAIRGGLKSAVLEYGKDAEKAAHNRFADLRELDRQGYDIIFIKALDSEGAGFSVMNRMLKSAGYDIIKCEEL